ncbi:LysR substrate-binding domain-containing protein [Luedemannella helvata]|uniref:LysR family transcriptional regulator n=1 Tax=Luedemannella helvata TaxID=349315 RepID=A0ABP4VZ85_9ACTN
MGTRLPDRQERTDLRSLEWLIAVAEQGSIGGAARALGVRQPSVTERLGRLERQLHLPLLERTPRGTSLTEEGAAVADWARQLLDASDRLEVGVAALRRRTNSQLRISASMTIAEYLLPDWLTDLRNRSPGLSVALRMCNSTEVARDVLEGGADLGFVEGPCLPTGLRVRPVGSDELVVVVPAGHPWTRRPVRATELVEVPLVMRERGSGTRDTFDRAVSSVVGRMPVSRLELGSTAAIKAAVLAGQGIGVLSGLAAADDLRNGTLVRVQLEGVDLRRRLRLIWRSGSQLSDPAARLASCVVAGRQGRTGGFAHRDRALG